MKISVSNSIESRPPQRFHLLAFISQQDSTLSPEALRNLVESMFLKLQECWQARDYTPMKPVLMPALFTQHQGQLMGMVRNHEINRLEGLKVERIDLVHVRYTEKKDQREFAALITTSARDVYVDDRWKLKEALSPARAKKIVTEENVDEESSAGQIDWYYRQSHAT
jgi:hypothetical protein